MYARQFLAREFRYEHLRWPYEHLRSPYLTGVLLKRGMNVNVNATTALGLTPLMYCAFHGHTMTLRGLLASGGDVHVKCRGGETALDLAVLMMNTGCVLLLLQHDATLTIPEEKPYQALHGLIYLKKSLPVDLLKVLRLYLL